MIKPGIHIGLGMEEYHAWSLDKDILIQPASWANLMLYAQAVCKESLRMA
jgi:hypothetical protein